MAYHKLESAWVNIILMGSEQNSFSFLCVCVCASVSGWADAGAVRWVEIVPEKCTRNKSDALLTPIMQSVCTGEREWE